MLVGSQDFTAELLKKIHSALETEPTISRRALSLRVCEWLDWKGPNGKPKEMSCRVALLKLHRQGIIKLPAPAVQRPLPCKKGRILEPIEPVNCSLKELGPVELVRIGSPGSKASRLWKAWMGEYHYLGSGPLCGAQGRDLIQSPRHGWLGGLAFSGAAWLVEARDRWIGWSEEARRKHLEKGGGKSVF